MDRSQPQDVPSLDPHLRAWVLDEVMDHIQAFIYITDPETDEILFMNQTMRRAFALDHPEGQICWKLLQKGMAQRCPFCPVPLLRLNPLGSPPRVWEEQNTLNGRIYENYDSIMLWLDGRKAHLQYSMDITETKQLALAATVDELTGVLNRRAGKAALRDALNNSQTSGIPITVCMYDVNDLKAVNDANGHQAGDDLLVEISRAVQAAMGADGFLFRLSGDEFIAVLPGARPGTGAGRMRQAAEALHRADRAEEAFCFGVLELPERCSLTLDEVLSTVDEQLYTQKRRVHIQRAERLLQARSDLLSDSGQAFTYDQSLLYDALVQSTDDYIYICNMKTGIFRYSQAMVDEFGLPGQVIENAAAVWGAKVHENDKSAFLESNQEITDGRTDCHYVEYRARNRNGEWVWLRCRGHLERDGNGEPALFAGIITNLGKKNRTDPLTGLFNKFEFERELQRLLESPTHTPLILMHFGIDELRRINNLYDRGFGDEVIRIVSQRLQSLLPATGAIYRLDGDEFGVILRGNDRREAIRFFDSVQTVFSTQQEFEGKKFFCTLSCGCASAPEDSSSYQELVKYAGYAMDYAKLRGKNRLDHFSPNIMGHVERSLELTELLRESMEHDFDGFEVWYQPVFTLDRTLHGAEALTRWSCKKYGRVPPDEFIGLLESSGLILPVGRWIFRQAARQCARFLKEKPDFNMSINLSCLQLEDPELLPFIRRTLSETGVDPHAIIVELTESYLAANIQKLRALLEEVRDMGIKVAMDDFGTGYSSLSILKQAPVDIVKIDRAFVQDIRDSSFDRSFIRLVAELCHIVGISICLEGVETEEEYEITHPLDINYLQGFLLGRPVPAPEFLEKFLPGGSP